MSLMVGENQDGSNSPVSAKGPAVLLPHEAIGNVVTKTNTLILEHRDWLANLPQRKERIKREIDAVAPPPSLITPAPSLDARYVPRQLGVLPECVSVSVSVSSSAASQLSSVSSTCSVRIASLQAALNNAEAALSSAQESAAGALSTASISARAISTNASIAIVSVSVSVSSSASSALASAQASASSAISSAISSAQSSASLAIASAQSIASASVLSANNALNSVQASASSAVASANAVALSAKDVASQARATASLAVQSAEASVVAAQQSATATRVKAMNETVLALTITFSIIGSSLISILVYYLISRCRRSRRERKQSELKERIHRVRHESNESLGPSLSAFPMPVGRDKWMSRSRPNTVETAEMTGTGGMLTGSATLLNPMSQPGSAPLQGSDGMRRTWAPSREVRERGGGMSRGDMDFTFGTGSSARGSEGRKTWAAREMIPEGRESERERERPTMMVRKNTLTYDPEHPERPPKFTTWLEESFRSVSPFPDMEGESKSKSRASFMGFRNSLLPKRQSLMQRRRSKSMGEMSDIGTAI